MSPHATNISDSVLGWRFICAFDHCIRKRKKSVDVVVVACDLLIVRVATCEWIEFNCFGTMSSQCTLNIREKKRKSKRKKREREMTRIAREMSVYEWLQLGNLILLLHSLAAFFCCCSFHPLSFTKWWDDFALRTTNSLIIKMCSRENGMCLLIRTHRQRAPLRVLLSELQQIACVWVFVCEHFSDTFFVSNKYRMWYTKCKHNVEEPNFENWGHSMRIFSIIIIKKIQWRAEHRINRIS